MMNRRSLLKSLLAAPALSMPSWICGAPEPASGNDFYILLHGIMFMEHGTQEISPQKDIHTLVATLPSIASHILFCGLPPSSIVRCDTASIDWTSSGLPTTNKPNANFSSSCTLTIQPSDIPQDIPQSMLQFSRSDTDVGQLNQTQYIAHKLIFPWPNDFQTIRLNDRPPFDTDFPAKQKVQVKDAIARCCPSPVGVVSVLHYVSGPIAPPFPPGSQPVTKYHYYFQDPSGLGDINSHLKEAKKVFQNSNNFDLTVNMEGEVLTSAPVEAPGLPGLDESDEYAYLEPHKLSKFVSLYLKEKKARKLAKTTKKKKDYKVAKSLAAELDERLQGLASSANCPNFYIGP